ncbi:uncharacterized protein LOC105695412 [Orussus abietinus]|uniref:uncharacterized protein LOC105695412 n=1 Tax=Orussus abietinus TaxID=222816 RepID=UPI000625964D|nr:uncharacterized protein LOC105695412 [Orussus abietinus]
MSIDMKALIHKRGLIKSQLTRLKNAVAEYRRRPADCDRLLPAMKISVSKVEDSWPVFDEIQTQIELLTVNEDAGDNFEDPSCIEFQNTFYETVGAAREIIDRSLISNSATTASVSTVNNDSAPRNTNNFRLPKLELPSFNGSYDTWLNFRDTFVSIIHSNASLPDVQKLHYLRSSLKEEASDIIASLETSSENYSVAWNLLKERYDNQRIIILKHIGELLNFTPLIKANNQAIGQLVCTFSKHIRALKALKQPTEAWDSILIGIMLTKFDTETRIKWEESLTSTDMPTMSEMTAFLEKRRQALDATAIGSMEINAKERNRVLSTAPRQKFKQQSFLTTDSKFSCSICKGPHQIQVCKDFLALSVPERYNLVKEKKLCFNCLRSNHMVQNCKCSRCTICSKKHHSKLHPTTAPATIEIAENQTASSQSVTLQVSASTQVLLSTALVHICDSRGKLHPCRVLLDSGSQSNFITEKLATDLHLPKKDVDIPVAGLNQDFSKIDHLVSTTVKSRDTQFKSTLSFLVIPKITGYLPADTVDVTQLNIPKNVVLADPEFYRPSQIDALLGAEIFYKLLCIGQIRLPKTAATLQKTHFGWVISGRIPCTDIAPTTCHTSTEGLQTHIENFGKLKRSLLQTGYHRKKLHTRSIPKNTFSAIRPDNV